MHHDCNIVQTGSLAPQQPQLLDISKMCNRIEVTWAAPNNTGGLPIVNYELFYRRDLVSEPPIPLSTNFTTTLITLDHLLPATNYTIQIRANNSINSTDYTIISATTQMRSELTMCKGIPCQLKEF